MESDNNFAFRWRSRYPGLRRDVIGPSVLDFGHREHAPLLGGVALSTRIDDGRNMSKESRSIRCGVFDAHNANIAVLGDAELLLPMKRSGDCGATFDRESIATVDTKAAVLSILEGGDLAFRRRSSIYGY